MWLRQNMYKELMEVGKGIMDSLKSIVWDKPGF